MADQFLEYLSKVRYFSGVSGAVASFKVNGNLYEIKRDTRTGIVTITFESNKGAFHPRDVVDLAVAQYRKSSYSGDLKFVDHDGSANFNGTVIHFFFKYDEDGEFPANVMDKYNGKEKFDRYIGETAAIAMQAIDIAVYELSKSA